MSDKSGFSFDADNGNRVFIDPWDDGGVWLAIHVRGGSSYTSMSREQAKEMLKALEAILASETA